jgi:FkbM family methyltransferase
MTNPDGTFGALSPSAFDRMILALTTRLPDNWLGLRLAILLRRAVTMRLGYPAGALDVERWGMRLRLHPRDNGCEKNLLFTPRMYEPVELKELAAEIARAKEAGRKFNFVDIGANVGLFSMFAAARAGRDARILAIEPEPGNLRRLDFNLRANPGAPITIVATALSDEPGNLAIEVDRRDRGGTHTRKQSRDAAQPGAPLVPSQTLLGVLAAENFDTIDALKIDVEGFEDIVLNPFFRDAPRQLRPRLIIIEDSRHDWKTDLMATLAQNGYKIAVRSKQNIIFRREPGNIPAPANRAS